MQGAEAVIEDKGDVIIKNRIKKGYRIEQLDSQIRKRRTRYEARLLREAKRAGVNVPRVLEESDYSLKLEKIDSIKVKDMIEKKNIGNLIGIVVEKLHRNSIIHNDLTTSNMLWKDDLFIIDFGLGFRSDKIEDKAIDLYVFKRSLISMHFNKWESIWKDFEKAYTESGDEKVIKALSEIEKRGRYKDR